MECPEGTSDGGDWCVLCDIGTYQSESGQMECLSCPAGYTTQFEGTEDVADCNGNALIIIIHP